MFIFDVANRSSLSSAEFEGRPLQLALFVNAPDQDGVAVEASYPAYTRQTVRLEKRSATGTSYVNAHGIEFAPPDYQAAGYAMLLATTDQGDIRVGWGCLLGDSTERRHAGLRIGTGQLQLRT